MDHCAPLPGTQVFPEKRSLKGNVCIARASINLLPEKLEMSASTLAVNYNAHLASGFLLHHVTGAAQGGASGYLLPAWWECVSNSFSTGSSSVFSPLLKRVDGTGLLMKLHFLVNKCMDVIDMNKSIALCSRDFWINLRYYQLRDFNGCFGDVNRSTQRTITMGIWEGYLDHCRIKRHIYRKYSIH